MAYCSKCGTELEFGSNFCPECGKRLEIIEEKAFKDIEHPVSHKNEEKFLNYKPL